MCLSITVKLCDKSIFLLARTILKLNYELNNYVRTTNNYESDLRVNSGELYEGILSLNIRSA